MSDKEMIEKLREKLDMNMTMYQKEWHQKSASELVDIANEISAAKFVYSELFSGSYPSDCMEYLLRFENPLEVVRDQWISEQAVDYSKELNHALWTLQDKGDAEQEYALDPEYRHGSTADKKITVREFIERHPDAAFDMMTPGGYVYLTSEKAQLLLSGQSIKGHPGSREYSMEISAEELLNQEVCDANFSKGRWYILSSLRQEPEQGPFEQGVTMC